ncbi:MAG: exodeoxyribonuclease VII large subunit [Thermoanaerobaculia bacterium]|nr:exodeoxyribonuclease VII large subunit [Thermoanaerobaculia bacterium]
MRLLDHVGPGDEPTYRVSQLGEEIRDVLGEVFPGLWVRGEVHRPRVSQRGHLYFELVEKGHGDRIVGKLDAVLWRTDHQRVRAELESTGQEIAEGHEIRCFGQIDLYPPSGRLQLVARHIDPLFSLGELERRRRSTLRTLAQAGLLEANQKLHLPELPLRIGLVTSENSAAYHDFLTSVRDGGYAFDVVFVHASTQGPRAELEVASALDLLAELRPVLDVIVLVRGGGSRSDLASFDSRRIAEAVARCSRPVICGLGHEIDRSIADLVCHTSVKTPTEAATLLVDRVRDAEDRLLGTRRELASAAQRALGHAEKRLQRLDRIARNSSHALAASRRQLETAARSLDLLARRRIRESAESLDQLDSRLVPTTQRALERAAARRQDVAKQLIRTAGGRLQQQAAVLDGLERLTQGLSPQRLLERGYSVTRGPTGHVVTHPDQIRSGDLLETRVAGGSLSSTARDPSEGAR